MKPALEADCPVTCPLSLMPKAWLKPPRVPRSITVYLVTAQAFAAATTHSRPAARADFGELSRAAERGRILDFIRSSPSSRRKVEPQISQIPQIKNSNLRNLCNLWLSIEAPPR